MASQVDICNRALIKLGAGQITSITDNNKQARVLSALWDTVRQAELSKSYWNFALARTTLAASDTTPSWGFDQQFQLPFDFLKLMQVNDTFIAPSQVDYRTGDDSAWAIEADQLLTNFPAPLKIRYVKDVTDPSLFDPLFADALAAKLAMESCYTITQSRDGQRLASDDYRTALRDATTSNAVSRPPQGLPDDSWVLGRL